MLQLSSRAHPCDFFPIASKLQSFKLYQYERLKEGNEGAGRVCVLDKEKQKKYL